jgi:uncharacterized protein YbcI
VSLDPTRTDIEAAIGDEIVRIHRESFSGGDATARVHLLDNEVLVIIEVDLSPSESTLVRAGRGDAVKATHESFEEAIESTYRAVVERATGRRVIAFVSHMHLEPDFAVELFRLEPHTAEA